MKRSKGKSGAGSKTKQPEERPASQTLGGMSLWARHLRRQRNEPRSGR